MAGYSVDGYNRSSQQSLQEKEHAASVRFRPSRCYTSITYYGPVPSPDKNPDVKGIHERFARLGVIAAILRDPVGRKRCAYATYIYYETLKRYMTGMITFTRMVYPSGEVQDIIILAGDLACWYELSSSNNPTDFKKPACSIGSHHILNICHLTSSIHCPEHDL